MAAHGRRHHQRLPVPRIDATDFLLHTLRPTLKAIDLYSLEAEKLLMGTAAQESNFRNVFQAGGGPAKGPFQMETITHDDLWSRIVRRHSALELKIRALLNGAAPSAPMLMGNAAYAVAMCRVKYWSVRDSIPRDLTGWSQYWKRWYNTPLGKGSPDEFIANWHLYVDPVYARLPDDNDQAEDEAPDMGVPTFPFTILI